MRRAGVRCLGSAHRTILFVGGAVVAARLAGLVGFGRGLSVGVGVFVRELAPHNTRPRRAAFALRGIRGFGCCHRTWAACTGWFRPQAGGATCGGERSAFLRFLSSAAHCDPFRHILNEKARAALHKCQKPHAAWAQTV
ncbi:hypothetical protein R3P38DRAFT_2771066 [Favolaschia claudopus]|uniref:Secreted protein n=1 Tax=Favolaschia claudopus TaxID=2862362 RepID=A0AAV9ZRY1_9AGAR